ncbi:MAG: PAS domain S-box protein, partial [Bacteroidota bacterium]
MTDSNSGLRILIVEDSPGDQFFVTELLKASVLKIQLLRIADTLAKAIDFLDKEEFDIILLDLMLPDSSGIDTFKNIKEPAGTTPVVILSGVTDTSIAVEAIIQGAQDYHIKGEVDEKILTRAILYSIERKRNTEEVQVYDDPYITVKRAKLDLIQSEEIIRQIMHGALDGIVCIDAAGKITVWNPQAEKIFGWKQEEILGKVLSETIIPHEHRDSHTRGMQHFFATGEGPILNKLIEITALNKEGQRFPIELTVIPLTENGNQFFCAFVRDISERKKVEEIIQLSHQRLKNAELIGRTGYWHWDVRTDKVTWSEGTYYVFGEVPGNFKENFDDFIRRVLPEDLENVRQTVQRVYESKQSASYGFWIKTPQGEERYISTTAEVILDDKGEVVSMFGTTNDKTASKIAREKEKRDMEQKQVLAKLNETISRAQAPEEIYELTLNALLEAIQADKASILLFDENGKMCFVASRNLSEKYKKAAEGHSPWKQGEKNARPIFVADVSKEPGLQDLLPVIRAEGICALVFIPLIHQHKLLGKFMVYFTHVHEFDEDDIQVIQNIAANVAFAISEKRSAVALKESEEKHRALFESSLDGILLVIPEDGTILAANPAACRILQMTEEEICRAGREGIVDKDDTRFSSYLRQRQQTGKVFAELSLVKKDGSKFPVEISSALFKDAGGKEKASILFRDITERKNAETKLKRSNERYELIGKATNDALWELDLLTNKVWGNETLYKLYGLNHEKDDLNDVGLYTRIHPEDSDSLKESFRNAIEKSELSIVDEYRFRVGDGTYRTVVDRAYIQYDENGKPVRLLGAMQDVTERKNTEEFLKTTRQNYISLVNTIEGIVWEADAKTFVFSFVSERAERLLGYPISKWIEEPLFWA